LRVKEISFEKKGYVPTNSAKSMYELKEQNQAKLLTMGPGVAADKFPQMKWGKREEYSDSARAESCQCKKPYGEKRR